MSANLHEIQEAIERVRTGDRIGTEELLLLLATIGQGQTNLDPTSLITGLLLGGRGRLGGLGGEGAILALLLTASNANAQQAAGGIGMQPMAQSLNPLLLVALLGLGREEEREGRLEVIERLGKRAK